MTAFPLTSRRALPGKLFRSNTGVKGRAERIVRDAIEELTYRGLEVEADVGQHADHAGHLVHTHAGSFLFEARESAYTSGDLAAITMRARVLAAHLGYEISPAICLADDRTVTLRRHAGVWVVSLERLGDWAGLQREVEYV